MCLLATKPSTNRGSICSKKKRAKKKDKGRIHSVVAADQTGTSHDRCDDHRCQSHADSDLAQLTTPRPFGWAVFDRRATTQTSNAFSPIAGDNNDDDDDSDADVAKTISTLRQDIEQSRRQTKQKLPKFRRPTKQTQPTKTRRNVYAELGVQNPERVAAVVQKIVDGQLEVPAPEDGITKGKMLNRLDSGSSIHAASHTRHYKGTKLVNRHQKTGFTAANGSLIKTEGEMTEPFTVNEGHDGTVTYINADVEMPILSTNGLAKNDSKISYEE